MLFYFCSTVFSQSSDEIWQKGSSLNKSTSQEFKRKNLPTKYNDFTLDITSLKSKLGKAPKRSGTNAKSGVVISFPNANGELEQYSVLEASVMEDELQNKNTSIRSYVGKGINNASATVRFSVTPMGLHAMILKDGESTVYIDPKGMNNDGYLVYSKSSLPSIEPFVCKFDDVNTDVKTSSSSSVNAKVENANDGMLRTFRLAIATTGEYSQYHLTNQGILATATDDEKKTAVLSAIVTTMTRVNALFERDVALTMVLVSTNKNIIFLNATTDGFTNDDGSTLIDESQTKITSIIGVSNYDIGHTFSTGGGGLAQLNSPCTTYKARGITGSSSPIGDAYDVDYVAHEMGHQFGAHHTFNSTANGCSGNVNSGTAVEPGSGSTIMAYAGLCSPYNVQTYSDDYFHLVSIREMWNNISAGYSTCGVQTSTSNAVPVLDDLNNYTLPISTPFALSANATDTAGDNLTYTWEQLDTETTTHPLVSTATGGPAFRSIKPSTVSTRYFPDISTVLAGSLKSTWEVLPSVSRTMKFGVTVRDNVLLGGQTASKETTLTFDASAGPFKVTSQNVAETWQAGTAQTITWDVANTNIDPVSCEYVNILYSKDGGSTFTTVLASNVSNDGSHIIVAPTEESTLGRIKIESVGNVFYAVNAANITIQSSEFIMSFDEYTKKICVPNSTTFNFTYNTYSGFAEETTFSASGLPNDAIATFNPTKAQADGASVEMVISGLKASDIGEFNISVTGTPATASLAKTTAVTINAFSTTIDSPTLLSPENNEISVLKPYSLSWENDVNAEEYTVEISTDNAFSTITETATLTEKEYLPSNLQLNTKYYWRVKSLNRCGESDFSSSFNFTTADEVCSSVSSTDVPVSIPDNSTTGVSSKISITQNKIITDLSLTVNITHPWVGDLTLELISPTGTTIVLATNLGDDGDGYTSTTFSDSATNSINLGIAPFSGSYTSQESLSTFLNEESYGDWKLFVVDGGAEDVGSIDSWSLNICGVIVVSDDDDKDGVLNSNDLCPYTTLGADVDETGCEVFTLSSSNFTFTTVSETCPDKNNGQITITALETHTYQATINGTVYNFTNNSLSVTGLEPDTYDVCISVTGENYEQCYIVTIAEGTTVSGKAIINSSKAEITIDQGTAPYIVFINDMEVLQTSDSTFPVDVKQGDIVLVKTAIECEGIFSKTVDLYENILAYPNPTKGNFEIAIPTDNKNVVVELYSVQGQLISKYSYPVVSSKIQLSLENKPSGLYFAKVILDQPTTIKILKQ